MSKIKVIGQFKLFKQESAHRQTDGHTDASKRIIAPATRLILMRILHSPRHKSVGLGILRFCVYYIQFVFFF